MVCPRVGGGSIGRVCGCRNEMASLGWGGDAGVSFAGRSSVHDWLAREVDLGGGAGCGGAVFCGIKQDGGS